MNDGSLGKSPGQLISDKGRSCHCERFPILIASLGEKKVLMRAKAYAEAGADMILIHSKKKDPSEIESLYRHYRRTQFRPRKMRCRERLDLIASGGSVS
ncbi:hypothetical protein [Mesorhizobium sp. BHbdii]